MTSFTRKVFSNSTDGRMIEVNTLLAENGILIHTTSANSQDEVWLWANNTASSDRLVVIDWGATTSGFKIFQVIPGNDGLHTIIPGTILTNTNSIRAHATVSSSLNLIGYVNHIAT